MRPEPALELRAVGALHDEDDVGPFHQFSRARLLRIGRQPGGGGLHAGPIGEHLLGRGRAQAIAGTEEEEVGQVNRWNELPVAPSKDF